MKMRHFGRLFFDQEVFCFLRTCWTVRVYFIIQTRKFLFEANRNIGELKIERSGWKIFLCYWNRTVKILFCACEKFKCWKCSKYTYKIFPKRARNSPSWCNVSVLKGSFVGASANLIISAARDYIFQLWSRTPSKWSRVLVLISLAFKKMSWNAVRDGQRNEIVEILLKM